MQVSWRDAGPEQLEQRAGGRRLQAVVLLLIGDGDADQMQRTDGARGGDVEQALVLVRGTLGFELLQVIVGARFAVAGARRKSPWGAPLAFIGATSRCSWPSAPATSSHSSRWLSLPPVARCRPGRITVSNSRPLDLWMVINCTRIAERVGRRVQFGGVGGQRFGAQVAGGDQLVDQREEGFDVVQRFRRFQAARPAEHQPDAFEPAPRVLAAAAGEGQLQHVANMLQALPAVFGKAGDAGLVLHQLPDRRLLVVGGQRVQVGQLQAAPRGPQQRQPMHAVGAVVQGAEQGQQVLHMLAVVQPFDIDCLKTQIRRAAANFVDQRIEVAAGANEDGDAFVRCLAAGLLNDGEHAASFFSWPSRCLRAR